MTTAPSDAAPLAAIVHAWLADHEWGEESERDGDLTLIRVLPSDDGAPWPLLFQVREKSGTCMVAALLPEAPADRREALALAMMRANNGLAAGRFDLDLDDGDARFVTNVDVGSDPLPDANVMHRLLTRALSRTLGTVDAYVEALSEVIAGADATDAIRRVESTLE